MKTSVEVIQDLFELKKQLYRTKESMTAQVREYYYNPFSPTFRMEAEACFKAKQFIAMIDDAMDILNSIMQDMIGDDFKQISEEGQKNASND